MILEGFQIWIFRLDSDPDPTFFKNPDTDPNLLKIRIRIRPNHPYTDPQPYSIYINIAEASKIAEKELKLQN